MKKNLIVLVTGFCFGAATGTAIALWNAPQDGRRTQAKIRRRINGARTQTEEAIADVQDNVRRIRDRANDLLTNVSIQA